MVEMTCETHDRYAASTQFISHFIARVLYQRGIGETPIDTKNVATLRDFATRLTEDHSFDLFSGLHRFNRYAAGEITQLQRAVDTVVQQLRDQVA